MTRHSCDILSQSLLEGTLESLQTTLCDPLCYFISRHRTPERPENQPVSDQVFSVGYITPCPFTRQHLPNSHSTLTLLASHLALSRRPGTFLSYRGDALSCLVRGFAKMAGPLTNACFSWGLSLPALKIARAFEVTGAFLNTRRLLYQNYPCSLSIRTQPPNTEAWPLLGLDLTCQIEMGREARQVS